MIFNEIENTCCYIQIYIAKKQDIISTVTNNTVTIPVNIENYFGKFIKSK